jgi:branched-chain amino acid transport system ATP-binding protein
VLELTDLSVDYGRVRAIWGISLSVQEGTFAAILGPNGSGKSSLLKAISGAVKPSTGSIVFEGRRIGGLRPEKIVRLGLALVPERRELFPEMTVIENLTMGAYSRRDKRAKAEDLERVFSLFPELYGKRGSVAAVLSGGQQQMVSIGRALMSRPRLLQLDEPSLGLAPLVIQRIVKAVREIHAEGTTVLLVEQNASVALEMADYAYILGGGRIRKEGPSSQLAKDETVRLAYFG